MPVDNHARGDPSQQAALVSAYSTHTCRLARHAAFATTLHATRRWAPSSALSTRQPGGGRRLRAPGGEAEAHDEPDELPGWQRQGQLQPNGPQAAGHCR